MPSAFTGLWAAIRGDVVGSVRRLLHESRADRHFQMAILIGLGLAGAVMVRFSQFWHVPGLDVGQWLSIAHYYQGRGVVLYSHPAGYPPLYFLLLAFWTGLLGDLPGILAAAGMVFFLIPTSAYAMARILSGDRNRALLFATLVGTGPALLEMSTWGGYPNLLSFVFLFPALAFLKLALTRGSPADFRGLGLFVALTALSHALSTAILIIAILVFVPLVSSASGLRVLRVRLSGMLRHSLPVLLALVLPFLVHVLLLGERLPEWLSTTFAPPAFSSFSTVYGKMDPTGLIYTTAPLVGVSDPFLWVTLGITLSLVLLLGREARILRRGGSMAGEMERFAGKATWSMLVVSPFLLGLGLVAAGAAANMPRLAFYTFPMVAGLAAWAGTRLLQVVGGWSNDLRVGRVEIIRAAIGRPDPSPHLRSPPAKTLRGSSVRRIVVTALLVFVCGWAAWGAVNFQSAIEVNKTFLGAEDRELVEWVRASTPPGAIIVATEDSFKWIEGLTGRAAIAHQEPWHVFRSDEMERGERAMQIQSHRLGLENGPVRVRVQSFGPASDFSPAVEWTDGLRYRGLWMPPAGIELHWEQNGTAMERTLADGFNASFTRLSDPREASFTADYVAPGIGTIQLRASILAGRPEAAIQIAWTGSSWRPTSISIAVLMAMDWEEAEATAKPDGFLVRDRGSENLGIGATFLPPPADSSVVNGSSEQLTNVTLRFDLSNRTAAVSGLFTMPASPVRWKEPRALLTEKLIEEIGVTHIVVLQGSVAERLLPGEYGYPSAFSNTKYVVYAVA